MRTVRKSAAVVALGTAVALVSAPLAFGDIVDQRISGPNRYLTSIEASLKFGSAPTVYLARGDEQADALTGGKLKDGPLMMVQDRDDVVLAARGALKKLGTKKVVVLGGEVGVPDTLVKKVVGDIPFERVRGANRYATAAEISKKLAPGKSSRVYLANGVTLVDALAAGTMRDDAPILLTNGSGSLPQATVDEIKRLVPSEVIALGGSKAVLPQELSQAASVNGGGGALSQADATARVQNKIDKEKREADMAVNGWFTVDAKTTAEAFAASAAKKGAVDVAQLKLTWPRVLFSEVNTDEDATKIFAAVGETKPVSAKAAFSKLQFLKEIGSKPVATYAGTKAEAAIAGTNAKATAQDKQNAFNGAVDGLIKKNLETDKQIKGNNAADTLLKAAKALGEHALLDPNTGLKLNTQHTIADLARVLGVSVPATITESDEAKVNKALKDAYVKIAAGLDPTQAALVAADANAKATKAKADAAKSTPEMVQAEMGGAGAASKRISGANRVATAVEIAKVAHPAGTNGKAIYLANATSFADAIVTGFMDNNDTLAGPVLLVNNDLSNLDPQVKAYLEAAKANVAHSNVKAMGGVLVVSNTLLQEAITAMGGK